MFLALVGMLRMVLYLEMPSATCLKLLEEWSWSSEVGEKIREGTLGRLCQRIQSEHPCTQPLSKKSVLN